MSKPELVVIGASAGGVEALRAIIEWLPPKLPLPIAIVMHTRGERESSLPQILSRKGHNPVTFAVDGAAIEPGHLYVAPPDVHLLIEGRMFRLSSGPRENGFRPAVDPLFRTAARAYGARLMGVILSGALDDGTLGLGHVKASGGVAVVQDPAEARVPSMPQNALRSVEVDYTLPSAGIAELIAAAARRAPTRVRPPRSSMANPREPESQSGEESDVQDLSAELGPPSGLTCPDCGGALWQIHHGRLAHYRCHVGHQFSVESLDAQQQDAVEGALWTAVRVLEEHAELRRQMAQRAEAAGMSTVSSGFAAGARDSQQQAHTIRGLLFRRARSARRRGTEPSPHRPTGSSRTSAAKRERKTRRRSR